MLAPEEAAGKALGENVKALAEAIAAGPPPPPPPGGDGMVMTALAWSSSPGTPLLTVESSSKRVEAVTSAVGVIVPGAVTVALISRTRTPPMGMVGTDQTPVPPL
jgi:hypothetical protein